MFIEVLRNTLTPRSANKRLRSTSVQPVLHGQGAALAILCIIVAVTHYQSAGDCQAACHLEASLRNPPPSRKKVGPDRKLNEAHRAILLWLIRQAKAIRLEMIGASGKQKRLTQGNSTIGSRAMSTKRISKKRDEPHSASLDEMPMLRHTSSEATAQKTKANSYHQPMCDSLRIRGINFLQAATAPGTLIHSHKPWNQSGCLWQATIDINISWRKPSDGKATPERLDPCQHLLGPPPGNKNIRRRWRCPRNVRFPCTIAPYTISAE